jgi:hypothetical protein
MIVAMQGARRTWYVLLVLAACGGSSTDGGDGGDLPDGAVLRHWDRQPVRLGATGPGVSIAAGAVDLAFESSIDGEWGIVWQPLGGDAELVEASFQIASRPQVARDAGGVVHLAWGTSAGVIRHATRAGGSWSVETVATERFRPALAIAADGTLHLAFVDEATGNGMVEHAEREAQGWQITAVHGTRWIGGSQVGLALTGDGRPVIAAPATDGAGVWVAIADGAGGWGIEDLAADRTSTGPVAVAVGDAGIAVAFKDGRHAVAVWCPASGSWLIEDVSRHDFSDGAIGVVVAAGGPLVLSDVDVEYPNGLALLERTGAGWSGQLLGPRSCADGAVALDPAGEPAVALTCNYDGVYYMTVVGRYPDDWSERCAAAVTTMCERACTCGVDGEACCWGLAGSSTCTSAFGCPHNAIAALCGDPTATPAELAACHDELPSLTCSAAGPLDLSGACASLYDPFR